MAAHSVRASVAGSPCDVGSVPKLLDDIQLLGQKDWTGNERARLELVENARRLVRALETPRETMIKHALAQPITLSIITLGIETGLFSYLAKNNGEPKHAADVAEALGIQPPFLYRLMRHLAAMGYLTETSSDTYLPTNFTKALTLPNIAAGYSLVLRTFMTPWIKFPSWARENNYVPPESAPRTVMQYAYNTNRNFFDYVYSHPDDAKDFNNLMTGYRQGRPVWTDAGFYPVQERLIGGLKPGSDSVLLVDVGGGLGQDISIFQSRFPEAPGRLVLQDRPEVTAQEAPLHKSIERMPHDFFKEQTVKGARAYYIHSVLHNWSDGDCVRILGRIKEAMEPGYSRLLINDQVVPSMGAHWEVTALDLEMMAMLSTRERSEAEWHQLLENMAGLRVEKIWTVENGVESIIECVLP